MHITSLLFYKSFSKQFNGFCHSPQDFHLCIIQFSRTYCVRRSECSSCGCTGVSLSDSTGHGVSVSTAFWLSKVLNCFIQLSKNAKEDDHLSYIPRWKIGGNVTNIQNCFFSHNTVHSSWLPSFFQNFFYFTPYREWKPQFNDLFSKKSYISCSQIISDAS